MIMANTPLALYQTDLQRSGFEADPAQAQAVEHLQRLYEQLVNQPPAKHTIWVKLKLRKPPPITGLYLWGGVGRGKTYLMDMFYDSLPFRKKLRMHFHHFMQRVHHERKLHKDCADPLVPVAKKLAAQARVLCFDEFVVNDVADAVILVKLLKVLFEQGVSLVATSNVEPVNLYKGGLQRDLFMPAIDLLYQHTQVINLDSGIDYRLRFLNKAETYFYPLDDTAEQGMHHNFAHLAGTTQTPTSGQIEVESRKLNFIGRNDGVIWFDFAELCDGPRSQNDYIELASVFHSILVSNVPIMTKLQDDQARRFINLIDVLYDHNANLIICAQAPAYELYQGTRVAFEFKRTVSRLQEMQSHDYLARPHKGYSQNQDLTRVPRG